ncbi:MAG: carbohydrate kinase family protein [Alphaproteobacteria bacterium]|nr:carbohydrate kinase family protein [Alphaproteobacteria bacterium]
MSAHGPQTDVVTVGRVYCDLIFTDVPRMPTMGTEVYAGGFGMHAGGGAAITAAHLVAQGRSATLAAILPGGAFGPMIRDELHAAEIDLSLCRSAEPGTEAQVTAALVGGEDRAFITHRSGPAAPRLNEVALGRTGAQHMHIAELATLVEMPELLTVARAAGMTVSLDCSWDETVGLTDAAPLIAAVDVFLPNAAEAERLADMGAVPPVAPITVIKEGAKGATVWSKGGREHAPAKRVTPVDTTGAGDAFNAGFLHAWLGGQPLDACLFAGNTAGARAIGVRGGFPPQRAAHVAQLGHEVLP